MSIFNENPKLIYKNIKELLLKGEIDRHHSFHTPVFCNISKNNFVDSRVIVLRKFDKKKLILNFHTDFRSKKIRSLKTNHNSFFVFYDHKLKIQLRIKTSSVINNQNKTSKFFWNKTRLMSRKCYLTEKPPSSSTKIPEDGIPEKLIGKEPTQDESNNGYKNFTVVENFIKEIDWLYLSAKGHRRMKISFKKNSPVFKWLIP